MLVYMQVGHPGIFWHNVVVFGHTTSVSVASATIYSFILHPGNTYEFVFVSVTFQLSCSDSSSAQALSSNPVIHVFSLPLILFSF